MATPEKLTWIQENLVRRDTSEIARTLNLDYSVVYDILKGKLFGIHGEEVMQAAEERILKRHKQRARDRKKYGTKDPFNNPK